MPLSSSAWPARSEDPDDLELMSEVCTGNVRAFEELHDRFRDRAYGVAYSVCGDRGRAQDAVQEAFLTLWKSRTSYRPERGTVAAWLLTVVRYRAIDLTRRNANRSAQWAGDGHLDPRPTPDIVCDKVLEQDTANRLRASLQGLPDEQREVIILAYFGQLSHSEIAVQLSLPTGTVKGRMRLGLRKLRASMSEDELGKMPAAVARAPTNDLGETAAA